MSQLTLVQQIAVLALPVLLAITIHEAAHALVARYLGDDTAASLGRASLNPLRHIDPLGTIVVPLVMYITTPFLFGWAKPVPVNWSRLRQPKRDMGLVALAGPASNLLMAVAWSLLLNAAFYLIPQGDVSQWLIYTASVGVLINGVLMLLNLLPILPLDGGRILASLLPAKQFQVFTKLERFGLIIVVLLLVSGFLGRLLWPALVLFMELLQSKDIIFSVLLAS
ncbi:MAG: site-2 protease family protein [gamma proteobacterium symbiont of Bathyaustriella thionipta]|nr:site-2 protease family protein [gamma proteobacterium symbiont of Bathyaustriella thionipta]